MMTSHGHGDGSAEEELGLVKPRDLVNIYDIMKAPHHGEGMVGPRTKHLSFFRFLLEHKGWGTNERN